MSSSPSESRPRVALLDTTVQVDRRKMASRAAQIEALLSEFPRKVTTSICLLEFKATIIGECIAIHDNLRLKKRFTLVRDLLLEKKYRQGSLRAHIFDNLVGVFASSFDITEREDERLGTKARLKLQQIIPRLYDWFVTESVDAVLRDGIQCTRAAEKPDKGERVSFRPNLSKCVRGKNKTCMVEGFIRQHAQRVVPALEAIIGDFADNEADQLRKTLGLFSRVAGDDEVELSHGECRNAGDCLIALEGMQHASHAVSTNATEWAHLCEILGMELLHVRYDGEKTR